MVGMGCQTIALDGAMGTRLQQEGLAAGMFSPTFNIQNPQIVRKIHQLYLDAGAQILLTNTFGATSENEFAGAVQCIQNLSGEYQIAGSIGPTTSLEWVKHLVPVVDFFIMETFSDLQVARKTFSRLKSFRRQIAISFAWIYQDEQFHLYSGETVHDVLQEIRYWPLLAFGANCAIGPALSRKLGERIAEQSPFDVWIKPNADSSPEDFARDLAPLIGVVRYVGGCCGSDERHITAFKNLL
jgi:5-methyltetrahydrofolate--homocysteine methyltransferase